MVNYAGQFKGTAGSITHIPILLSNEGDMSHPVPDMTGSLSDGFIHFSSSLHDKNIYPPIDVLLSSSRYFTPCIQFFYSLFLSI